MSNDVCDCSIQVKVKKLSPDAIIPKYAKNGDAARDLHSIEDFVLLPNERYLAHTGLSFELPINTEIQIRPRSGLAIKHGITIVNSPGTVDCVPYGTKIRTPYGEENVEDFLHSKNKKILYSFSEENNSIEEDVVSDMWVVNDTKLVRIETEDGIVEIPDNKMLYTKRGWIEVKNLSKDDEILSFL